jgi:hypothetical protein
MNEIAGAHCEPRFFIRDLIKRLIKSFKGSPNPCPLVTRVIYSIVFAALYVNPATCFKKVVTLLNAE